MDFKMLTVALSLGVLTFWSSPIHAQQIDLAQNGGFEADPLPPNSFSEQFPSVTGWDVVCYLVNGRPEAIWPSGGAEGSQQYADAGNAPDYLCAQTFVVPTGFVVTSIQWRENAGVGNISPYIVEVHDQEDTVIASSTHSVLGVLDQWGQDEVSLDLSAGTYKVVFYGTAGLGGADVLLDEVRILAEPLSVPGIGHGDVINIDAQLYGDAPGVPTLDVRIPDGDWVLIRRNPELHPSALYYAWTHNAAAPAWRTVFGYKLEDGTIGSAGFCCVWPPDTAEDAYDATPAYENQVYLSLPEEQVVSFYVGDQILHDNSGGVSLLLEEQPNAPAVSVGGIIVLAGVLMAIVMWAARRRGARLQR